MEVNWQILILVSVLLFSTSILLQRLLVKEEASDPKTYSIFFQLLTGCIIGGFGFLSGKMSLPPIKPVLINLILAAFLYGFGGIFMFEALKFVEASRFTIIFASRVLFTILASFLLLGEKLTPQQGWGTALILVSVIIVNFKEARLTFTRKETKALLAAAAFGLANTNDRFLLQTFQVFPYVALGFLMPVPLIIGLYPYTVKTMRVFFKKRFLLRMLILSVVYASSSILFFTALKTAPSSAQVVTVNLTSVIVTVFLAIVFLKEKGNLPQKMAGAILSFGGVLLVSR